MAVIDASTTVEILLRTSAGIGALNRLAAEPDDMVAPHLIDIEVAHALRRMVLLRKLSLADAEFAVVTLPQLHIERYPHLVLLPRIWQLRDSLSAYDAAYVALAELVDQPLFTFDAKLGRSHGHQARIMTLQ
jgi:predicted nucleic acid-binding protein